MQSKQSETKNNNILKQTSQPFQPNTQNYNYTPFQDLYTPTAQNIEINSKEPFIKEEESPENNPLKDFIFYGTLFAVYILFFSWSIINMHLKESSETDRITTGIDFIFFLIGIFYLVGLTFMVVGVMSLLLKGKKLKECLSFFGFGVVIFLFIMIFDYVFPICEAIVIDNNNKNITFLKYKIFVPLGRKKKLKIENIQNVSIVTDRSMVKNNKYYGFKVNVRTTNNEVFTGYTYWDENDNRKEIYDFLRRYLGEKVN